jgi:hypothetical protein
MRLAVAAVLALLATAGRAADPAAEAARSYTLEASASPASLPAGATGKLLLAVRPVAKAHVHPEAPLKVTLAATPGLALAKLKVGRGDLADPKSEAPRFEIPFTATAAGAQQATLGIDFFICTDQWCVKQVREVKVAVDVR